jgi:hypothetical protein
MSAKPAPIANNHHSHGNHTMIPIVPTINKSQPIIPITPLPFSNCTSHASTADSITRACHRWQCSQCDPNERAASLSHQTSNPCRSRNNDSAASIVAQCDADSRASRPHPAASPDERTLRRACTPDNDSSASPHHSGETNRSACHAHSPNNAEGPDDPLAS